MDEPTSDQAGAEGKTGSLGQARDSFRGELAKGTPVSKAIAHALDDLIRIPGTSFRIGLDPILGLVPYGGEAVASIIGCFLLADAGSKGVPVRTLVKMGGNVLVNAAIGAIPVAGDIFSAWFKSNARNYKMLRHWLECEDGTQAKGGWGPLVVVASVALSAAVLTIGLWVLIFKLISALIDKVG